MIGGQTDASCPPGASCAPSGLPALSDGAAFEPATGRWSRITKAPHPISSYRAAVLGEVLYLINQNPDTGNISGFLAYDAVHDRWSDLPKPAGDPQSLIAIGERLVALAGTDERGHTVDTVFDPVAHTWSTLPDDPIGPSFDREAVWLGDRLLLAAQDLVDSPGSSGPSLVRLAELDGDLRTWKKLPTSPIIGTGPVVAGGRVVWPQLGSANGGGRWARSYDLGGIYNPDTGAWSKLPAPGFHGAATYQPGPVLPVGAHVLAYGRLLDPVSRRWQDLPPLPHPERMDCGIAANEHALFRWGGSDTKKNFDDGYYLAL